jgi:hypothetical protein
MEKNLTTEYKMAYRMKTRRNKNKKNNEATMGGKRRKTHRRSKTHRRRHTRK